MTSGTLAIVLSLFLLAAGVYSMITGRSMGKNSLGEKYTEESLKRFNRLSGIIMVVCALCIAFVRVGRYFSLIDETGERIGWIGVCVCILIYLVLFFNMVRKKDDRE